MVVTGKSLPGSRLPSDCSALCNANYECGGPHGEGVDPGVVPGAFGVPGVLGVPGVPAAPELPGFPGAIGLPGEPGVPGVPGLGGALGFPGVPGPLGIAEPGRPGFPGALGVPEEPGVPPGLGAPCGQAFVTVSKLVEITASANGVFICKFPHVYKRQKPAM